MAAQRPPVLRGRASEREVLDRLLENVRGGQSAVLVIHGEAGVGKTALLRYCARQASGFRVAADRGRRVRDGVAVRRRCISSARRCWPARRASRAAAARPERRVRPVVGRRPRPLPGRPGRAQPAGRGRRGAAAALPRRRRAVARRRLGPGARLRRATAAGGVGGDGVRGSRAERRAPSSPACRTCRSEGSDEEDARALLASVIPGRLDEPRPRPDHRGDARQSARAAGAAAGHERRRSWPAASRFPTRAVSRVTSRTSYRAASRRAARADAATDARGGRRPGRRCDAAVACRRALGIERERGGAGGRRGLAGDRRAGAVPASARRSAVYRSASTARTARRFTTRWRTRPIRRPTPTGEPGIARRRRRARRGRRRGARAVGRPGAGARRARRGGRVPGALGRADRRSGAPRGAGAGGGAGQHPSRRVRCGARAAGRGGGRAAGRVRSARGWTCCALSSHSHHDAATKRRRCCSRPPDGSSHSTLTSRATRTSTRWRAALFGGRLGDRGGRARRGAGRSSAPRRSGTSRGLPTCCWTAFALLFTDGCDAAAPMLRASGCRRSAATRPRRRRCLRWVWHATVVALELWDDETWRPSRRPSSELAREPGALGELRVALNSRTPVLVLCGDSRRGRVVGRGGTVGHRGDGDQRRAVRRVDPRSLAGPGRRGESPDRRHASRRPLSRRGNRNRHRAARRTPCSATASGRTKRRSRPPGGDRLHDRELVSPTWGMPSSSRPPHGPAARAGGAKPLERARGDAHGRAGPTGRSGSTRGRAPC